MGRVGHHHASCLMQCDVHVDQACKGKRRGKQQQTSVKQTIAGSSETEFVMSLQQCVKTIKLSFRGEKKVSPCSLKASNIWKIKKQSLDNWLFSLLQTLSCEKAQGLGQD